MTDLLIRCKLSSLHHLFPVIGSLCFLIAVHRSCQISITQTTSSPHTFILTGRQCLSFPFKLMYPRYRTLETHTHKNKTNLPSIQQQILSSAFGEQRINIEQNMLLCPSVGLLRRYCFVIVVILLFVVLIWFLLVVGYKEFL